MKLSLFLNHQCNLRCTYCYNGEKFDRRMSFDLARRAVDLALSDPRPRSQISFFGGEPLLELDLIRKIVAYAEERALALKRVVRFVVTTNGTLLNEARLDYLMEHGFHLGVSLDGTKKAHDAHRRYGSGRSCHALVCRNLERAVRRYPPTEVIAVVDPANVHLLHRSFQQIFDLGVKEISFNMNYEADWTDRDLDLLEEAFSRLAEAYIDTVRKGHRLTVNPIDAKIITRLKEGYSCNDRCDFGCNEIAVSPLGNLYPCDRLVGTDDDPDIMIGDIFEGVDVKRRDELREAKNARPPECAGCAVLHRCMYWCGCVNYASTGRVNGVTGTLCWMEQLFIRTADMVARTLYEERNPVFLERYYLAARTSLARGSRTGAGGDDRGR